jgi:hypothetical protein
MPGVCLALSDLRRSKRCYACYLKSLRKRKLAIFSAGDPKATARSSTMQSSRGNVLPPGILIPDIGNAHEFARPGTVLNLGAASF